MGSSASTRVASPGGSAVVGQTGIMGRSWLTGVAYSATVCRWRNSMAACHGDRKEGADRLPRLATCAEVLSGAQSRSGERGSVAAVQSVGLAVSVLEILAALWEAGVAEVAAELGVHKSTVCRLVAVLESRGFVEQLADRCKYRLGFGVVRLAGAAAAQLDIAREGRRVCETLAADLEETVNIAILDSDRAVNVSQARGPAALSTHNWVGQSTPLHATSSGKVLLAHEIGRASCRERV